MKTQMRKESLDAYESIRQDLPRRKRQVFEAFAKIGPATNRQISVETGLEINQVTGRTNELVNGDPPRVYEFDKVLDLISNVPAIRWDVIPENGQLKIL